MFRLGKIMAEQSDEARTFGKRQLQGQGQHIT